MEVLRPPNVWKEGRRGHLWEKGGRGGESAYSTDVVCLPCSSTVAPAYVDWSQPHKEWDSSMGHTVPQIPDTFACFWYIFHHLHISRIDCTSTGTTRRPISSLSLRLRIRKSSSNCHTFSLPPSQGRNEFLSRDFFPASPFLPPCVDTIKVASGKDIMFSGFFHPVFFFFFGQGLHGYIFKRFKEYFFSSIPCVNVYQEITGRGAKGSWNKNSSEAPKCLLLSCSSSSPGCWLTIVLDGWRRFAYHITCPISTRKIVWLVSNIKEQKNPENLTFFIASISSSSSLVCIQINYFTAEEASSVLREPLLETFSCEGRPFGWEGRDKQDFLMGSCRVCIYGKIAGSTPTLTTTARSTTCVIP